MLTDGIIAMSIPILTLIASALSYIIFKTINNYIEKKYGVKPGNKLETIDFLLDAFSKRVIELTPILTNAFEKKLNIEKIPAPIHIDDPDKITQLLELLGELMNEFVTIKTDLSTLTKILLKNEQAETKTGVNSQLK